jgi:nicotinamide phosphoribosyltransferase
VTVANPIEPLLNIDGYKLAHKDLYPDKTTRVQVNWTNRASRLAGVGHVVHFGLQAALQKYLVDEWRQFFEADEDFVVKEFQRIVGSYLGKEGPSADHIRALHKLGHLPLRISAVPEGSIVPLRVPTFIIENTHDDFFWLPNYVETVISASYWHRSTTATIANEYRRLLDKWAKRTGGDLGAVLFQAHDFSFRGQTSVESAAASGAAHLTSFVGTDSLPSILFVERYYSGDNGLIGASVPATEHSVMCAGSQEGELETFQRILDKHEDGIVSVVSDTWSLWDVVLKILPALKDQIMARDGKLVIRPDSGDPEKILCGDFSAPEGSPESKGLIQLLWELFGGTVNDKGFKELDPHIGAIYGDSITLERADNICRHLYANGFASTNVVFGVGSFTYQFVTRDTFSSAIKATWAKIKGIARNLMKDPVTDNGMKKSATGRLAVVEGDDGELTLIQQATPEDEEKSVLKTVWEDGEATVTQSLADVRAVLDANRRELTV